MIEDYYKSDVDYLCEELVILEELFINNDNFLIGLSDSCNKNSFDKEIPIIKDLVKAERLMCSQDLLELPEPRSYQYFIGEIEDETGRLNYKNEFYSEDNPKVIGVGRDSWDKLSEEMNSIVSQRIKELDILKFLSLRPELSGMNESQVESILKYGVLSRIVDYLLSLLKAIEYGGIRYSKFFTRMYEIFLVGGVPCGWIGIPSLQGGSPEQCMQMLYFDNVEK